MGIQHYSTLQKHFIAAAGEDIKEKVRQYLSKNILGIYMKLPKISTAATQRLFSQLRFLIMLKMNQALPIQNLLT